MLNKILEFFPPPRFLSMPSSGIHISDSFVRVMELGKRDGHFKVAKYKEVSIPPGTVVSGEIVNKEPLVNVLKSLKQDLNLNKVRVSLPEEKAYLFTARIPIVDKKEVRSAIESKIEENVPVSPAELIFDYKIFNHKEKQHLDIVVSNLPVNIVENYVDVLKQAELSPLSLEIESQAMVTALISKNDMSTSLIVNFTQDKVGLYIESYKIVRFTSTISTKSETNKNPNFLLQEIKKLFLYWHTLKEYAGKADFKIGKIIICGDGVEEPVVSYLSSNFDVPVIFGNVWTNVLNVNEHIPEISFFDSLKYAGTVGLALPKDHII